MLSAFISTLRTADLRRKIIFTLGIVILYRAGAALPSPGVNYQNIQQCVEQVSGGAGGQIYSLINLFSGGALLQLSVFAVGVMPYITASIIVQLLTVVIPRFEELRKEGQSGQAKMTQYTRYLSVALAVLQAIEDDGLLARAADLHEVLATGLVERSHDLVSHVRGRGLLIAAVLVEPPAADLERAARSAGLIVNAVAPDAIRLAPPLTISDVDISDALDRWDAACSAVVASRGPA